jgi:hypothetical protein
LGRFADLPEEDRAFIDAALEYRLTGIKLTKAFFTLTMILEQVCHRKPVVLIDEYDTPTAEASRHGYIKQVISIC